MKEQKTKASPKLGGRTSPIERYNTRTDRKTSQSGPLVFSAFVFALFFAAAIAAGVALVRRIDVWVVLVAFGVASLAAMSIHIAMQWEKVVVMRFGKFHRMQSAGLYFTIPFVDQTALRADQRVVVTGFGAEETLTSDLVPINVDAVLFWMVWDAQKACLEVENYYNSVSLAAQTALRDAIGRATASEVAVRRNQLDEELQRGHRGEDVFVGASPSCRWRSATSSSRRACRRSCRWRPRPSARRTPAWLLAEVERDISEMLHGRRAGLRKERGGPCACGPCTCSTRA